MDNLTHSLVGALLGQMGLKRKTGLAMPTLIIAANIPDIDAVAVLLGGHQHLAIRRGITHGPIAMVLLPLLLWAAMLWFDRWQTRRGTRPEKRLPVNAKWLLILAYIGCLSHPLFDWFNSYGIRLLEPFSSQWFYGDTLFIVDVWIWVALILAVWLSIRRERLGLAYWTRPAWIGFAAIGAYIVANGLITEQAERAVLTKLIADRDLNSSHPDPLVVANPLPIEFWRREVLWREYGGSESLLGSTHWSLFRGSAPLEHGYSSGLNDPYIRIWGDGDASLKAFNTWTRMPYAFATRDKIEICDQRFSDSRVASRFCVVLRPPKK